MKIYFSDQRSSSRELQSSLLLATFRTSLIVINRNWRYFFLNLEKNWKIIMGRARNFRITIIARFSGTEDILKVPGNDTATFVYALKI